MSSALTHLKHTLKKFPEKCMLKGPIAVSIYGQLVKESQAVSTRQHHYRKKKNKIKHPRSSCHLLLHSPAFLYFDNLELNEQEIEFKTQKQQFMPRTLRVLICSQFWLFPEQEDRKLIAS